MSAVILAGGLMAALIILTIGLFIFGVWLLYVGFSDTFFNHKFSFWALLDIIIGFMLIGGGGVVPKFRKKD